jgi:hypothetical protein
MTLSPTHDDAVRQLDRLADRLRVVGPRLAAREGPEAAATLAAIRAGLQRLADLTADADHRPPRQVPELAAYALADQLLVLGHDLLGRPAEGRAAGRSDAFRAVATEAIASIHRLV